jgi:hypothetical protein
MDVDFDRLEGEAGIEFVVKEDEKLSDLLRPLRTGASPIDARYGSSRVPSSANKEADCSAVPSM